MAIALRLEVVKYKSFLKQKTKLYTYGLSDVATITICSISELSLLFKSISTLLAWVCIKCESVSHVLCEARRKVSIRSNIYEKSSDTPDAVNNGFCSRWYQNSFINTIFLDLSLVRNHGSTCSIHSRK
jgi:hypothetical protein